MKNREKVLVMFLTLMLLACQWGQVRAVAPDHSVRKVTIWYEPDTFPMTNLFDDFMETHPDVAISIVGIKDEDPLERLFAVNLKGESEIDFFVLPGDVDSQMLFKRGYAAPITSAKLMADIQSMYPQVQRFVMRDDMLFAFPVILYLDYWTVNLGLLERAGYDAIPETLNDYFDMMLAWYESHDATPADYLFEAANRGVENEQIDSAKLVMGQMLYAQAVDASLSFNSPVFRAVLEQLSRLSQWREKQASNYFDPSIYNPSIFNNKAISPFAQIYNPEYAQEQHILPPVLMPGMEPVVFSSLSYFIVNPASDNMEDAIRFLEFYSEHMDLGVKYSLHPDFNEPVMREGSEDLNAEKIAVLLQQIAEAEDMMQTAGSLTETNTHQEKIKELQQTIANLKQERYVYSDKIIACYRELATYIDLGQTPWVYAVLREPGVEKALRAYFAGNMTLDQTVMELDRIVALAYRDKD